MDWQFAFQRSEMWRRFQSGLLSSIGHELRSPLARQQSSLQMLREDLCDSEDEKAEYLEIMQGTIHQLLSLLQEFSGIAAFDLPIESLAPHPVALAPLLTKVQQLTKLQAADRGIVYTWPDPALISTVYGQADPNGLLQAFLGISHWSIQHLQYGSLGVHLDLLAATDDLPARIQMEWVLQGRLTPLESSLNIASPNFAIENTTQRDLDWQVISQLVQAMSASVDLDLINPQHWRIRCVLSAAQVG